MKGAANQRKAGLWVSDSNELRHCTETLHQEQDQGNIRQHLTRGSKHQAKAVKSE